ncbi:MAG: hypothetical protein JWL96_857 [Sphingomonas bacterium]|uniref:hypothetical protein n=1 Tax=Sphingomonas bacterium TaxID=1895847 RepID=UPI002634651F|nr:hypothetical protein [Sphingomonas bacterium]MDB5708787.1 hypothetical protein [Sphingomonas bacterium]
MSRHHAAFLVLAGIAACAFAGPAFGGAKRTYRGAYENGAYNFRVTIPKGLTGYDDGDPDYQRGFTIDLKRPSSKLDVWSEPNSLEYRNPCQAVTAESRYTKDEARGRVLLLSSRKMMLGPMRACEGRMRYVSRRSGEAYASMVLCAIGKDEHLHTILWIGPVRSLARARRLIDQLKASWGYDHDPGR